MKIYQFSDFREGDAWVICRVDSQVQAMPIDIYMVIDLPSGDILSFHIVETTPTQIEIEKLIKEASIKKGSLPRRLIIAKNDPAELLLETAAKNKKLNFEAIPAMYLEALTTPIKKSFAEHFFSPSGSHHVTQPDHSTDEWDIKAAQQMIPDSYDPCPCASGKKYKFCCKAVFQEIMEAMVAAEEGKLSEALGWINKAKKIAGETAEILCREAIVYSFFDMKKSEEIVDQCLSMNPNHPRANYIRGITYKSIGNYSAAMKSYETAIANYPPSDHFHLNEVYNNLGGIFYALGDLDKAKTAWEKAVLYSPYDKVARENLADFIYKKPIK